MSLFSKLFPSDRSKKEGPTASSWAVILKGVPDKKVEEALIRIFTERLGVPGDDALKVIRSAPIILFADRTAREAEQIKLVFNGTGARTAISNEPHEFKKFPRISWPRAISVQDLGGVPETSSPVPSPPSVFKSQKPIVPPVPPKRQAPPVTPPPPLGSPVPREKPVIPSRPVIPSTPPVSGAGEDWKGKYDTLQKSFLDTTGQLEKREAELRAAQDRLKKLETEVSLLQPQLERFRNEKFEEKIEDLESHARSLARQAEIKEEQIRQALREKDEIRQQSESYHQDLLNMRDRLNSLEKEKADALSACQHAEKTLEDLRREILQGRDIRESLQKEVTTLRSEKDRLTGELEKIRMDLELQIAELAKPVEPFRSQVKRIEKLIENIKGGTGAVKRELPVPLPPPPSPSYSPPPLPPKSKPIVPPPLAPRPSTPESGPQKPPPPPRHPGGGTTRIGIIGPQPPPDSP